MRDAKRLVRTPEAALDEVSDHMGEVLRRADELLAEWSRFGDVVRVQVEREAQSVGDAVASSVEAAAVRGVAASVDRALTEHVGARLTALAGEIARLEARARAATRAVADERAVDRKVLWVIAIGVIAANVLLAVMLLRPSPDPAPIQPPPPVEKSTPTTPSAQPAPSSEAAPAGGPVPALSPADPELQHVPPHAVSEIVIVERPDERVAAKPPKSSLSNGPRPDVPMLKASSPQPIGPKSYGAPVKRN
jgi:hypothetical protein